jgi:hypothetical protein
MEKVKTPKKPKNTELKITCHYNESGKDISETLRESFKVFVKRELAKQSQRD